MCDDDIYPTLLLGYFSLGLPQHLVYQQPRNPPHPTAGSRSNVGWRHLPYSPPRIFLHGGGLPQHLACQHIAPLIKEDPPPLSIPPPHPPSLHSPTPLPPSSFFEKRFCLHQQWWARAMKSSLYFRSLIFCDENKGHNVMERSADFLNTFFNATSHYFSNTNKTFTFTQKINALKIKWLIMPTICSPVTKFLAPGNSGKSRLWHRVVVTGPPGTKNLA